MHISTHEPKKYEKEGNINTPNIYTSLVTDSKDIEEDEVPDKRSKGMII